MTSFRQWKTPVVLMALAVGFALGMALSRNGASAADEQQAAHDAHGDAHGGAHGSAAGGAPGGHSKHWAPVDDIHLYLCAFHVAKENPKFQVEAHHFCNQHKDVHQCLIYESNEKNARLLGVEYIIGHEAYQKLPDDEKKYWHPHAYEIMSGQLIAPDLPKEGDAIFPGLTETWGKTWHTWRDPATDYPLGEPVLMWSANADGQLSDTLVAKRDAKFGVKTAEIRERRKAFGWAVPQLQPAKLEESGRKWTPTGDDKPVPLDKGRAAAIRVQ